jgi:hypothetical protein
MGNRPSSANSPVALDYVFGVLENKVEDTIVEFADGFALRLVEPAVLSFATLKRIVNPELSIRGVSLYASGGDVMVRAHVEGDSPDESLAILKTNAASRPKRRGKTSVWHLAEPSDHLKETLAGPVANVALAWLPINLKHAIGFVLGKTSFELGPPRARRPPRRRRPARPRRLRPRHQQGLRLDQRRKQHPRRHRHRPPPLLQKTTRRRGGRQ